MQSSQISCSSETTLQNWLEIPTQLNSFLNSNYKCLIYFTVNEKKEESVIFKVPKMKIKLKLD